LASLIGGVDPVDEGLLVVADQSGSIEHDRRRDLRSPPSRCYSVVLVDKATEDIGPGDLANICRTRTRIIWHWYGRRERAVRPSSVVVPDVIP